MFNIILQKFKEQKQSVFYYAAGLIAYVWMLIGMFPSMEKMDMTALYGQFPKEFLKFFGGDQIENISKIEGFMSIEFLSLFFILIIGFYVASSAGSTIAGSIEKKTMDFELSQPISRTKKVLSEVIVSLCYTIVLVLATVLSMYLLGKAYHIDFVSKGLIAFTATASVFLFAIYGIGLALSSILKNKITVASTTISIAIAFYVFNAMTKIIEKLSQYEKYSFFNLYNPQKLLTSGDINWNHILILSSITIIGIISSLVIFNKKDI